MEIFEPQLVFDDHALEKRVVCIFDHQSTEALQEVEGKEYWLELVFMLPIDCESGSRTSSACSREATPVNKCFEVEPVVADEEEAEIFKHRSEASERQGQVFKEISTLVER